MAEYEPIVGRYLTLDLGGRPHRLYFEEAGQGIPLVCLHTAGADSRQWRHLLNDAEITRALPRARLRHAVARQVAAAASAGRTRSTGSPRSGYVDLILAFCRALGLERPVVLGCSIGGKIVLELALACTRRVPRADRARVRRLPGAVVRRHRLAAPARRPRRRGLRRADVGTDRAAEPRPRRAGTRCGCTCRAAPASSRATSTSTGPTATSRDRVSQHRHRAVPALPPDRRVRLLLHARRHARTAAQIKGARVTVMKEIGHFPMSENPAQFRRYLLPVLEEIRARG